jgi:predicted dehydrogenase
MTIKAAIVGSGFAASSHVDALRRLPGVELVAVVGRTTERARVFADRFGIPHAFGSLDDVLGDDAIDVVHNCTPNDLHAEINLALLDAGKHVLSEKPLGRTADEAHLQASAATSAGVVSGVCFNYRHFPLVQHLRSLLRSNDLGPVHLVHGGYLQDWLLYEDDWSWRLDPEQNGPSRAVADIGSHWLDLVQHVTGDSVTEIFASLGSAHEHRTRPDNGSAQTFAGSGAGGTRYRVETEDFGTILLRFASGARGSLTVSQVTAGRKNRLQLAVDAARGSAAWDQEDPGRLWLGHRDAPNEVLMRDPSLLLPGAAGLARLPGGHEEGWADALRNLLADFYAAVEARAAGTTHAGSFASFADGAQLAELVDAALASDVAGSWVRVGATRVGAPQTANA